MRKILAALVAVLLLPLPAQAHTDTELAAWSEDWSVRMTYGESPELLAERLDMVARHPCRLTVCPQPQNRPVNPPEPTPIAVPAYPPGVEQWRSMVAHFWPLEHVDRMLRIMACESGGNPYADNPRSSAAGLFQIMGFWQKTWPGDYFDPWTNGAVAYQIWLSQGYRAWVCRG